eukprot:6186361-Pleurochrysis_carterae.AAC.1
MPGAYTVWVPATRSIVTTSDVYFDETLFTTDGNHQACRPSPSRIPTHLRRTRASSIFSPGRSVDRGG